MSYPHARDVLLDPTLILEVLSDSSEAYDRGDKFAHYETIPSLRDYYYCPRFSLGVGEAAQPSRETTGETGGCARFKTSWSRPGSEG